MLMFYVSMIDSCTGKKKFEQIYSLYKQTMYYTAFQILQQQYDAEDAVHNAFLKIIHHLDKIDLEDSRKTRSFLVIIAENTAIDLYRKRKKSNLISYDELSECMICSNTFDAEEGIMFHSAFFKLPIQYATILRLKYSHGYNDAEIAKILNISEANVRKRMSRAKNKLRCLLEEGETNEKLD